MVDSLRARCLNGVIVGLAVLTLAVGCDRGDAPESAGEETLASLRATLRAEPGNLAVRVRLARLYLRNGDGASAEAYFRRALDEGSTDPALRVDLARSLLLQEKFFDARELMERLRSGSGPATAQEWLLLGEALLGITSASQADMRASFMAAFRALAEARDADTAARLDALSRSVEVVATARDHVQCHQRPARPIEPLDPADQSRAAVPARTLRVGPTHELKAPSDAARVARDGDRIEIDAGLYRGDVAVWRQSDLTLIGSGGMVRLEAAGQHADGKGIWVFEGDRITAQNIAFSGARVPHKNGAGIKMHGSGVIIRNCEFRDNENGILGGSNPDNEVLVEFSTFERNGYGDGQSHNIYVGRARSFTLRYSLSRAARVGHLVKSRARETAILFNRLVDDDGDSSYSIDIAEGGKAWIVGNEIDKGPRAGNPIFVSFGEEESGRDEQALMVVNNTFYNRFLNATLVRNATEVEAVLVNNMFAGAPALFLAGPGQQQANVRHPGPWLTDPSVHDYRLQAGAPAIDAGVAMAALAQLPHLPNAEYRHPARGQARDNIGPIDVGAREFCGL